MIHEEYPINQNSCLREIMMKQKSWHVSQIDEQLYLIDYLNKRYNITRFKSEFKNFSYFQNETYKKCFDFAHERVRSTIFSREIFDDCTINLTFDFQKIYDYEEIYKQILFQKNNFQITIPNLYEKQCPWINFFGQLSKISFKYSRKNQIIFDYEIKQILKQLDDDLTKSNGSIYVNTIQIGSNYQELQHKNDNKNLVIELKFNIELKNIQFNNIIINCFQVQSNDEQIKLKDIQVNLILKQDISKLKIFLSGIEKIYFKLRNEDKLIPILEIDFYYSYKFHEQNKMIKQDISYIFNKNNLFSAYRIVNPEYYNQLLSLDTDNHFIIFFPQIYNKQESVKEFIIMRNQLNQMKFQIFAFSFFISQHLLYSPQQTLVDLYF